MFALAIARVRRRPARWLLTVIGIAVATAFAGAVAAQSTIAGDRAARSVLTALSDTQRAVTVTSQDNVTPLIARHARELIAGLGLGAPTEVVLFGHVRLGGVVVRPAAIDPLDRWLASGKPAATSSCTAVSCNVVATGGVPRSMLLNAPGVRMRVLGGASLRSPAPLGFTPDPSRGRTPVVLTGDAPGLDQLAGLSSRYRTDSWMALLPTGSLHSWQLESLQRHLTGEQATLQTGGGAVTMTAPFAALERARAEASASPKRLLLTAGGAVAALALFVVLAVGAVRRELDAELERLEVGGATSSQRMLFVTLEAAIVCGAALLLGAALAIAVGAIEASTANEPVGAILAHSLLTPAGAIALGAGWLCTTAGLAALLLIRGTRVADLLAAAAAAALAVILISGTTANAELVVLLAPLACLAAGVLVFRGSSALLRGGERLARRGPVPTRLAFVSLARSPSGPSLAIALIALSTGLGAFALGYRATLSRSSSDQAAGQVPLDATLAPGADFVSPLEIASLQRWRRLAAGSVFPIRTTDASFVSGGSSVTVPVLGVPAAALSAIHGWRTSDGSTPLSTLAPRLSPPGPVRTPGPTLAAGSRAVGIDAQASGVAITLSAELRRSDGSVRTLSLGQTRPRKSRLRAGLPPGAGAGSWQLEALEATEPAGLEATNGHQNGENPAAATQFATELRLGQLQIEDRAGHLSTVPIDRWTSLGAARGSRPVGSGLAVRFATSGTPALIRPRQPSDSRALPVLVDRQTAALAGRGRELEMTIDGLPMRTRVVGALARFPTVPAATAGFVVAGEPALSAALDAQAPGQGAADELWVATANTARLRAALARGRMRQLNGTFRADVEHRLQAAPVARAVYGTLVAAAALAAALAIIGLLSALLGSAHDPRIEADLIAQGAGPRALAHEMRLRLVLAAVIGVVAGAAIGVVLTRLAVATVRAAGTVAIPSPPLVTVVPWLGLAAWSLALIGALALAAWLATRTTVARAR